MKRADYALLGIGIMATLMVFVPIVASAEIPFAFAQVTNSTFTNSTLSTTNSTSTNSTSTITNSTITNSTIIEQPLTFPDTEIPLTIEPVFDPIIISQTTNSTTWKVEEPNVFRNDLHPYPYLLDSDGIYKPYKTFENDEVFQIEFKDIKFVFDKNNFAVSQYAFNETTNDYDLQIQSDSYVVKRADLNSDEWSLLEINNVEPSFEIHQGGNVGQFISVVMKKENFEGIFTVDYTLNNFAKTTAKFENNFYENSKFSFTETLNLIPNEIILNELQTVNLDDLIGLTFDRQTLEQNEDIIISANNLFYRADIGFDQLWSVQIFDNRRIALDYANVGETETPIGQYVELDPTTWVSNPAGYQRATCYQNSTSGSFTSPTIGSTSYCQVMSYTISSNKYVYYMKPYWLYSDLVSAVPSGATLTAINFSATYITQSQAGNMNFASGSCSSSSGTMTQGTIYGTFSTPSSGYGYPDITLNSNAITDYNNAVATSSNWTTCIMASSYFSNANGKINGSYSLGFTYTLPPPDPPTGLTLTQNSGTQIGLSWTAPTGGTTPTGYKIERSTDNTTWTTVTSDTGNTNTSYTDNYTPNPNTTLYYRVFSYDSPNLNYSTTSVDNSMTTWDYPNPPTNVQTVDGIPLNVSWTAPSPVDGTISGYKVYRSTFGSHGTQLPNNGGTTPVDFTDNELLLHGTTIAPNQNIPITFDSSTVDQFTINGNTVTPTATSWVSKVRSIETFNPATGGGEIVITRSADDYVMVGFGQDPFAGGSTSEYDSIEFANYILPNYLRAYESGTQVHETASVTTSASDVFKVTMDSNGQVKYWHNGVAFYTSSKTASGDYYVHVAGNSIVSTTVNYIGDAPTITDSSPNSLTVTTNSGTTTTGVFDNGISTPNLEVTSSLLPDATDSFTVGSWVKQTATPTNTKLFGFTNSGGYDIEFNIGTTTADFKTVLINTSTTSQGNNGGSGESGGQATNTGGGGGGGAGGVGESKAGTGSERAGNGGIGLQSDITGTLTYYAGGGGGGTWQNISGTFAGGTGGLGGGGNGGDHYSNPSGATAGTNGLGGGGGGAGSADASTKSGGSGVVILQFTTSGTSYSTTGSPVVDTSSVAGKTILKYLSSGTFTINSGTPDVRYLVVGGGGGGSGTGGGGGGAGGFITGTKSAMSAGTYTVTVGAGGAGSAGNTSHGSNGQDSEFDGYVANGGGGGGHIGSTGGTGNNGGSGGGGGGLYGYAGGTTFSATLTDTTLNTIISATGLTDNTSDYQHYSLTRDSNSWTLYQNGQSVATATDGTDLGTVSGSHKINLDGSIDEYFIDSTALTSNEVETVYQMANDPTFLSTTGTTPSYSDNSGNAGDSYYYYVKTTTDVGDSQTYSTSALGTFGTPPDAITDLSGSIPDPNNNPQEVQLIFNEPISWGTGAPVSYEIYESPSGLPNTWTQVANPNYIAGQFTTNVNISSLSPLTDYYYMVRAVSSHGTSLDSNVISVTTPNVPDQVPSVTASLDDPDNAPLDVHVSWVQPNNGGSEIKGYQIERHDDVSNTWSTVVANTALPATDYQDTTVQPDVTYKYRVSAINPLGTGATSPESNTVLTPTIPDSPTGLVVTTLSDTQLQLDYVAPVFDGRSALQGYTIELENPPNTWTQVASTPNTTYTYTGTVSTEYNFRVSAYNNVGSSNPSSNASGWTLASAPTNLVASTVSGDTINLTFDTPTHTVTDYKVYKETPIGNGFALDQTVAYATACTPSCSIDVSGDSGLNYNTYIVAVNLGGDSTASNQANAWTLSDPPSNIVLTSNPNTATQVTIDWDAPTPDAVTGYLIERNDGNGWVVVNANTQSQATIIIDTGLQLSTTYEYRIATINLGGTGSYSTTSSITTYSPPDPPIGISFDLQKVPIGSNDNLIIKLTWDMTGVNLYSGTIQGYKIERNVDNAGWTVLTANTGTTGLSATETGLSRSSVYQYRVSTITQIATGSPSNAFQAEFLDGEIVWQLIPVEGNTIRGEISFNETNGLPNGYAQSLLVVQHDNNNQAITTAVQTVNYVNATLPQGFELDGLTTLPDFYVYDIGGYNYTAYVTTTQDGMTHIFESGKLFASPTNAFGGQIFADEYRDQTSYTNSTLSVRAQPADFDYVVRYQHQNPNIEPQFFAFNGIEANNTSTAPVLPNSDYYVSVFVNPTEFDYTIVDPSTGEAEVKCNENSPKTCPAWTSIRTPNGEVTYHLNENYGAIENIPSGIESDYTLRSFKSPDSPVQLGLEPMGDLFGMPMVFIFIIALGAVFTGRSAQMGVVFIVATIGLMVYMGYLSFDFGTNGLSEAITWGLIVVAMILGVLVGKRWS